MSNQVNIPTIFGEKSNLYATSDLDVALRIVLTARQEGRTGTIVYIGDPIEAPKVDPRYNVSIANGTPLCPDYNVLSLYINGDFDSYQAAYLQTLKTEPATRIFNAIFVSMMAGNDVILFFPQTTLELKYPELLLRFLVSEYGITAATKNTACTCMSGFESKILDQLYAFDSITLVDYLTRGTVINPILEQKMRRDASILFNNPNIGNMSNEDFAKFLVEIKSGKNVNAAQPLTKAFTIN